MTEHLRYGRDVRVTAKPDGRGYYRIRYTDPRTGLSKDARRSTWADAERLALELSGAITKLTAGRPTHGEQTLADLIEDHLEDPHGRYKPQSLRGHRSYLLNHVAPNFGHISCADWTPTITAEIVDAATARGLAPNTVSSLLRALGGLAETGRLNSYLATGADPCSKVRGPRQGSVDLDDLPTEQQIDDAALAVARQTDTPWRALHTMLLAYSGLRIGEACGLKVRDVDLTGHRLRVERQVTQIGQLADPKYDSFRWTILPPWLDDLIVERLETADDPDEPLLPNRTGGHVSQSSWRATYHIKPALEAGWPIADGRPRWTPHTLRHFFCTWALSTDGLRLDVADVAKFAGHKNPQTTYRLYVQSRPDAHNRAFEAAARLRPTG